MLRALNRTLDFILLGGFVLMATATLGQVLFRYFLHSRLWEEFAAQFMRPEQRDAVDVAAIEALLPAQSPAGS